MNKDDNLRLLQHLRDYDYNELENSLDKNSKKIINLFQTILNNFNNNENIKRVLLQFYYGTNISERTNIYVIRHPKLMKTMREDIKFEVNDLNQLTTILSLLEDDFNNEDSNIYKTFINLNKDLLDIFDVKKKDDNKKRFKDCNVNETTLECNERKARGEKYKTPDEIEFENAVKKEKEEFEEKQQKEEDRLEKIDNLTKGGTKPIIMNDGSNKRYALINDKKYQIVNNTNSELLVVDKNKFNRITI